MKVLAIDYGLANIGIAYGDSLSGIAFPLEVIKNNDLALKHIRELSKKRGIDLILVGKPYRADGSPGSIDVDIEDFIDQLLLLGPEIATLSERYTSKMAQAKLQELALKKKDRQQPIDDLAAQIMLQEWLETC